MSTLTVSQLWQYPLKSGQGNAVTESRVTPYGLAHDRHLIAVDDGDHPGLFLTARATPELLQLTVEPGSERQPAWTVTDRRDSKTFQFDPGQLMQQSCRDDIRIWKDNASGYDLGDAAAAWLSARLGQPARFVYWQPGDRRSDKYNLSTTYADAAPLLITTEASVAQACDWAGLAPDARRFRPNIILDGTTAFAEHTWQRLQIGEVVIELLDGCSRCILINRDPSSGERSSEHNILKTLQTRHSNDKGQPILGVNARFATNTEGVKYRHHDDRAMKTIQVGDPVIVLE